MEAEGQAGGHGRGRDREVRFVCLDASDPGSETNAALATSGTDACRASAIEPTIGLVLRAGMQSSSPDRRRGWRDA